MSDLAAQYADLAYEEDELRARGLGRDPPLKRAADGFELEYFRDVFRNRMRRIPLERDEVEEAFSYGKEQLRKGLNLCESPIERRMLHWLVFGQWSCRHSKAKAAMVLLPGESLPENVLFAIAPQHEVGPYRVDFAIMRRCGRVMQITAVECDGADYHEAERDRTRDDWLRRHGVQTFRATGSDIFRHPQEVFDRLAREMSGGRA